MGSLDGLLNATSAANLTSVCSAAKLCSKRMVYAPCLGGDCTSYPNGSYPYYNSSYHYYGEPARPCPLLSLCTVPPPVPKCLPARPLTGNSTANGTINATYPWGNCSCAEPPCNCTTPPLVPIPDLPVEYVPSFPNITWPWENVTASSNSTGGANSSWPLPGDGNWTLPDNFTWPYEGVTNGSNAPIIYACPVPILIPENITDAIANDSSWNTTFVVDGAAPCPAPYVSLPLVNATDNVTDYGKATNYTDDVPPNPKPAPSPEPIPNSGSGDGASDSSPSPSAAPDSGSGESSPSPSPAPDSGSGESSPSPSPAPDSGSGESSPSPEPDGRRRLLQEPTDSTSTASAKGTVYYAYYDPVANKVRSMATS